jgi:hypothetical protein
MWSFAPSNSRGTLMVLIGDSINYIESIHGISSADIATRYIFLYIQKTWYT